MGDQGVHNAGVAVPLVDGGVGGQEVEVAEMVEGREGVRVCVR